MNVDSILIELETVCVRALMRKKSVILSTIHSERNIVTHRCWDNFDMREEISSCSGAMHTAHGIFIQEAPMDDSGTSFDIPASLPRTKGLSITCRPIE